MLGALGALLMVVGDLALSIIHSDKSDRGLYVREAYMIGSYQLWRPVLLFATGLVGMFFYSFGIKAMLDQIDPKCRKLRAVMKYGGLAYICTGAALHFFIGTLSYWMTVFPLSSAEKQQYVWLMTTTADLCPPPLSHILSSLFCCWAASFR